MRCRKAQKYIGEYVDGSLEPRKAAGLERHIETCAACREVLADFRGLTAGARVLDAPEPGDGVWREIEARLAAGEKGRATVPVRRREARRGWAFGLSAPALRLAGAAALALVLIASGIFIGRGLGRKGTVTYPRNSEGYTLAKLDEAERYYQKAIKSLSEAFAAEKGTMVPQVAEMFEKNLSVIDATIQACRRAVLKEPDDLQTRNYLLTAYMDKVSCLGTALESQRQAPGVPTRGKSL
ncbi:MAG: zf-HC2 domain-containing protein [Candidatus Aminicenantales bacterium]